MSPWEKRFIVFNGMYLIFLVCVFIGLPRSGKVEVSDFKVLVLFNVIGSLWSLVSCILVLRDLYLRPFPDPNSKMVWAVLILTIQFSVVVYLFQHGFKPRVPVLAKPKPGE